MSTEGAGPSSSDRPSHHARRRLAVASLLRSLLFASAVVVGYFVLPFTSRFVTETILQLVLGLAALSALLLWQIWEILRSPVPGARAVGALMVSVPLFLTVFATTYYVMGDSDPSTFSEPMSRLDSMYFTVTMFATVGFGDITAVSETARAVAILQMLGGLVLVGLIARVIFGAVQEGRSRQDA